MYNKFFQIHAALILVMVISTFTPGAFAHVLPETSAKITLRDGQLEARLYVDLSTWKTKLESSELWLLGDTPEVLPQKASEQQTLNWMRKLLIKQLAIKLDNVQLVFDLMHFPDKLATGSHHHRAEIVIFSRHQLPQPKLLEISYPPSLGKVHNSISQPRYKLAKPGEMVKVAL